MYLDLIVPRSAELSGEAPEGREGDAVADWLQQSGQWSPWSWIQLMGEVASFKNVEKKKRQWSLFKEKYQLINGVKSGASKASTLSKYRMFVHWSGYYGSDCLHSETPNDVFDLRYLYRGSTYLQLSWNLEYKLFRTFSMDDWNFTWLARTDFEI